MSPVETSRRSSPSWSPKEVKRRLRSDPRVMEAWRRAKGTGLGVRIDGALFSPTCLVSVVIPMYEVEEHLGACLDSVLGQTYHNLEVVIVDDGSPDASIEIAKSYAARDSRVTIIRQANSGLGAARNTGARHIHGKYVAFVDSDDTVPHLAVERLVAQLERSGSDFAVGNFRRISPTNDWVPRWTHKYHSENRIGINIHQMPGVLQNVFAWGKLFRTDFYEAVVAPFPEGVRYEDQGPTARAYLNASAFDIVTDVVYEWRTRADGTSITQQKWRAEDVEDRFAVWRGVADYLAAEATIDVLDEWYVRVLSEDLPQYLSEVPRTGADYWEFLRSRYLTLHTQVPDRVWPRTDLHARTMIAALVADRRDAVVSILGALDGEGVNYVLENVSGALTGAPRYLSEIQLELPPTYLQVEGTPALIAHLDAAAWHDEQNLVLSGWAYMDNVASDRQRIWIRLVDPVGATEPLEIEAATANVRRVNEHTRDSSNDRSGSAFRATIPAADIMAALASHHHKLIVEVRVQSEALSATGPFTWRSWDGAAGHLPSPGLVGAHQVVLRWDSASGLTISRHATANPIAAAELNGRVLRISLSVEGSTQPVPIRATNPDGLSFEGVATDRSRRSVTFEVRFPEPAGANSQRGDTPWTLHHGDGSPVNLRVGRDQFHAEHPPRTRLRLHMDDSGNLAVIDSSRFSVVTDLAIAEGRLEIAGYSDAVHGWPPRLVLAGGHTLWIADQQTWDPATGHFTAVFSLTDDQGLARAHGGFGLVSLDPRATREALTASGSAIVGLDSTLLDRLPEYSVVGSHRIRITATKRGQLWARLDAPIAVGDMSPYARATARHTGTRRSGSRTVGGVPGAPTVLFETFGGRNCSDSPAAIHAELRERQPSLQAFWATSSMRVPIPPGSTRVLRDSPEYIDLLHSSRLLVGNANFPHYFRKQDGQFYLQTWHGTPLKRIGNDVPGRSLSLSYRTLMDREATYWDLLLAQNDYSARAFPGAFGYRGEILTLGYPRNDAIRAPGADEIRASVRAELGIRPGSFTVLYAPTWRDSERDPAGGYHMVNHLELAWASALLGPDYTILVRGHVNTTRAGGSLPAQVKDVSGVGDVAHLMLAADALITDYSSVMFDFVNTGKPLAFLVPDLDEYASVTRGLYRSLPEIAPGPLFKSTDEVIAWLKACGENSPGVNDPDAYRRFTEEFAPHDDGKATGRVVDVLLDRLS